MARYGTIECPRCGAGTKIEVVGLARFDCHECGVQLLVSGGGMTVHVQDNDAPTFTRNEQSAWRKAMRGMIRTCYQAPVKERKKGSQTEPCYCSDSGDCDACLKGRRSE